MLPMIPSVNEGSREYYEPRRLVMFPKAKHTLRVYVKPKRKREEQVQDSREKSHE
jgi:hypothetical protein